MTFYSRMFYISMVCQANAAICICIWYCRYLQHIWDQLQLCSHMAKTKEKKGSKLAAQLATRKSALKHSASHQKERAPSTASTTASTTASSSDVRKRITGKKAEKVFVYRTPDKSTDSIKSPPSSGVFDHKGRQWAWQAQERQGKEQAEQWHS